MWNAPTSKDLNRLPGLYATESIEDPIARMHFFIGSADWWITEYDPIDRLLYGFVNLGDPGMAEWGYISLDELIGLKLPWQEGSRFFVEIDRDLSWTPKPVSEVKGIMDCKRSQGHV